MAVVVREALVMAVVVGVVAVVMVEAVAVVEMEEDVGWVALALVVVVAWGLGVAALVMVAWAIQGVAVVAVAQGALHRWMASWLHMARHSSPTPLSRSG